MVMHVDAPSLFCIRAHVVCSVGLWLTTNRIKGLGPKLDVKPTSVNIQQRYNFEAPGRAYISSSIIIPRGARNLSLLSLATATVSPRLWTLATACDIGVETETPNCSYDFRRHPTRKEPRMTILNKSVTAIGIFFASCLVSLPNGFSQTSTLTAFYTAPVASMAP